MVEINSLISSHIFVLLCKCVAGSNIGTEITHGLQHAFPLRQIHNFRIWNLSRRRVFLGICWLLMVVLKVNVECNDLLSFGRLAIKADSGVFSLKLNLTDVKSLGLSNRIYD